MLALMQLLSTKTSPTLIADAQFEAAFAFPPPGTYADVSGWRVGPSYGVPAAFDLEIWSNASVNLTNAELFGGSTHPYAIADDTFTAVGATDVMTNAGHGYLTGDGPVQVSNVGGALPAGLSALTDYWVIKLDANTFKLAASLSLAMAGTPIDITTNGTGTQTLGDTADTMRLHWHSEGLLGVAGDGAVALTAQKAYRTRRDHRPRALFYSLVATLSASDPEWVSAAVYPIQDAA